MGQPFSIIDEFERTITPCSVQGQEKYEHVCCFGFANPINTRLF